MEKKGRGSWLQNLKATDPARLAEIATSGGRATSANREHMAEIGRKGGKKVSQDRDRMREIGRLGGRAGLGGSKKPKPEGEQS